MSRIQDGASVLSDAPARTSIERLAAALADRYRIEAELGQGGMATVFLAEDLKHDRKVAVKVLRPELAAMLGAERFVVEIKTTASLQHPHILPLFDSGSADGFLYYVMPYIEGETLREKLDRETQLGVEEAVRIATEVADALDYAHRHGVIHRDIKPENILLHDGRPMVADFGIALALSAAAGGRMTETGLSLGTPHYMSPEQATAEKELTPRSDIYSLGSVLYEMLTGSPPHTGASAQQIIMKIVTEEAARVTQLRKSVPPNVAAAVARAIERLPADRFESASAFAAALDDPAFVHHTGGTAGVPGRPTRTGPLVWTLAATTVIAAALAGWGWLRPPPAEPLNRYAVALPATQAVDARVGAPIPAPDGSFFVYRGPGGAPGTAQLWIKRRESHLAAPIPGSTGAMRFALSPDGQSVAFGTGGQLKRLPLVGGAAVTLVPASVADEYGLVWLDDGTIVYTSFRPESSYPALSRVSEAGGEPSIVWASDTLAGILPEGIPGRSALLFTTCALSGGCDLRILDLEKTTPRVLVRNAMAGQVASTGHLLYQMDGSLQAARLDLDALEVRGSPAVLEDSIATGLLFPARISRSGTLVLLTGSASARERFEMVWVDRSGRQTPIDTSWIFDAAITAGNDGWALAPDGTRLAIALDAGDGSDIWVKRLPQGPVSRISFDPADDFRPRWTPDGRAVDYVSGRTVPGLYRHRADGVGSDSLVYRGRAGSPPSEALVSPDGSWLLLREGIASAVAGGRDITGLELGRDSTPVPVVVTPFDEHAITPSPDGRWLAYISDETGRSEIFVRPFPDTERGKWQVSSGGGVAPLWSRDGRELFFLSGDGVMTSVPVRATEGGLDLGVAKPLFQVPSELRAVDTRWYTPWDVGSDGRFIMARMLEAPDVAATVIVVENYFRVLEDRLGR